MPTARTAEKARTPLRTKRDIIPYDEQYFDTILISFWGIRLDCLFCFGFDTR